MGLPEGSAGRRSKRAPAAGLHHRNPAFADIALVRERYTDQHKRVSDPAWRAGLRGQQLLDAGRNAEAERAFLQALRGYPREPDLLGWAWR